MDGEWIDAAEENFIAKAKETESARHGSKQGVHVVHLSKYLRNKLSETPINLTVGCAKRLHHPAALKYIQKRAGWCECLFAHTTLTLDARPHWRESKAAAARRVSMRK